MTNDSNILDVYARWLSDGESWIGCFENVDLSSSAIGHRVSFCYDDSQWDAATVGKDRAPDHKDIGLGWRYILKLKTRDGAEAVAFITREEVQS